MGPVLGPTLGGYLTDQISWRAAFYINVPVGILALLLLIEDRKAEYFNIIRAW